jgi:hypothetical protein
MKQNSAEDTAWLSKETNDFLEKALVWPAVWAKVFRVLGPLLATGTAGGVINEQWLVTGFCATATGWVAYKLSKYNADVDLITNEMIRREDQGAN